MEPWSDVHECCIHALSVPSASHLLAQSGPIDILPSIARGQCAFVAEPSQFEACLTRTRGAPRPGKAAGGPADALPM
eukprot:1073839-Alexandrium_andersonii.AAC.1